MELSVRTKRSLVRASMRSIMCLLISLIMLFQAAEVFAEPLESEYFEIILADGADLGELYALIRRDRISLAEIMSPATPLDLRQHVSMALDVLYLEIANILDMQPQGFSIRLEVYPDQSQVKEIKQVFNVQSPSDAAVFVFMQDRILVSLDELSVAALGHEIAQAIIARYFVVPPPDRVSGVLTEYVDRQLDLGLPAP
jgi:hypothetical protein